MPHVAVAQMKELDWVMDCQDPNYQLDDLNESDLFATIDLLLRCVCLRVLNGDLLRKAMLLDSEL